MPNPFPFMGQLSQNITDIPDDMREKALKRTAALLQEFNKIRCTLELPVDQLPIVIDTYGKVVTALVAEAERAELAKHAGRAPMTMQSTNASWEPMKIPPGKITAVTARPQTVFRPEDFEIHGDRSHWMVHDIRIGNRSQFIGRPLKTVPVPGTQLGPGGLCEHLRLETCQTAMDLVLIVEYIGPEPEGAVFEATVVGASL